MSEPSILSKLFNLSSAVITQVAAGCPVSSEEDRRARAEECAKCPSFNKEEYKCNECGCFLKYKIVWETSKCPLNKWER